STSINTARDTATNSITLTDALGYGDYLLSSSADPSSVRPSIITAVIGSPQVRVGAPTRYTIQFVNNSDILAEDFLLAVNTGSKVHIQRAEIPLASGGKMVLPKDSLFYENEDTTVVFYVLKMAPREERLFDIIVMGDPPSPSPGLKKAVFIDPVSLTAAAVVTWAAWKAGTFVVCKGIDYFGDMISSGLKLSPADQKRYDDAVKGGIPNELEQQPNKVKVFALKTVGGYVLKKTLDLAPGGSSAVQIVGTVTQNAKKIAPNLRQRIFNWFYKETGLYGVEETESGNAYQPAVSNATQKKGLLVRSWDPNEKVGPQGFGDKNFITTAARMKYQILFENKKEATAPAYKIAIVDTLRPEFDPETFEFGRTSHDGPQYNWVKTRKGNIISWVIEGIELPPNLTPPEGEGWVECSVMPKSGAASGTVLKNGASITFDMNPIIATNVFTNALDFSPPTTVMGPLAQKSTSTKVTVKWQSSDGTAGSGVESVALYASKDGASFNQVGETEADSLVVPVEAGTHRYSFYALARDNVGNVESVRPSPVTSDIVNDVEEKVAVPTEFSLSQNYPNPFNPTTEIVFSVSVAVKATLRIYDMLGREITTLVDEVKSPGRYTLRWDAGKSASGVYFYRLIAGDFVQTRRLTFIK
ncbi:MAG: T9SS type A sorting domain-containing protein, partial [Ignavibacteriales bacterium]|nr:T9SS type A sorting domain-containing protein [Ignavibacteriales bacterium]